ncbi:MAG: putative bifunctional diguanylate cyclase/phosphodiesterase [Acidobacteriaceae bacterium]
MAIWASAELDRGQRFSFAAQASLDGFWDLNLRTDEACFSPQWQQIVGLAPEEHLSTIEHWLGRVHPEDRPRLEGEFRALRAGKARHMRSEHRLKDVSGWWRWVMARAVTEQDQRGRVVRIAGSMTDETERKLADPLTGLPNRLFFLDHMQRRFAQARACGRWNFAVLSLGLERFKLINERLSYEGGDAMLIETAARLRQAIASSDAIRDSVIARLNAADFLVCLDGTSTEAQSMDAARQISEELRRPFQWRCRRISPAPAMGLAQADPAIVHPEELMRDADTALAEAKTAGRAHLACYSRGMRERALERMQLESDLEQAIREQPDSHQLMLYYQPEIDLATRRIIGFEALIRWRHPERGLVLPGEFIPLAEESDLILPLGEWGLTEACRQIVAWRALIQEQATDQPPDPTVLRVSVNLSAKQFGRPGLVGQVAEILARTAVAASALRLEVTESSLMNHEDTAKDTMHGLQNLGVGLHMDDFGTGYSSLNHLHRYPFDTLKIDRSFVQEMESSSGSAEIIRTILDLAHSLKMDVVAEGIETEAQAIQLQSLGCKLGQGYYFAKPMAAEAVSAMLVAN